MNKEEAIRDTKKGVIAASVSGVIGLSVILFEMYRNLGNTNKIIEWSDSSTMFHTALTFVCAYGMYKKSRYAAVVIFATILLPIIITGIATKEVPALGLSLLLLFFYALAIRGAFSFHKIEKAENPNFKDYPTWAFYTGLSALVLIVEATEIFLVSY